jgi:bacteriorhodopsin
MTDFETPLMRDLSKLMPKILLFLVTFIVAFIVGIYPIGLTEYGNGWIVQTTGTITQFILDNIRGVC